MPTDEKSIKTNDHILNSAEEKVPSQVPSISEVKVKKGTVLNIKEHYNYEVNPVLYIVNEVKSFSRN